MADEGGNIFSSIKEKYDNFIAFLEEKGVPQAQTIVPIAIGFLFF